MGIKEYLGLGVLGVGLLGSYTSMYTINEKEQAVILRFGEPQRIIAGSLNEGEKSKTSISHLQDKYKDKGIEVSQGAGLYFKYPWDTVNPFEDRVLEYDSAATDIVTSDKKRLLIDTYARFRILDPLKFMETVQTENGAQARLDDIIYSVVREETGKRKLIEIVRSSNNPITTAEGDTYNSEKVEVGRGEIMKNATILANAKAAEYGIQILDVRIKRADLPRANEDAVVKRMQAERNRIAQRYTSEGEEAATRIRAIADREATVIRTRAYAEAERIKGEGDAEATKIYAETFGKDPDFYNFLQTLANYRVIFNQDSEANLVVGTDNRFLHLFGSNTDKADKE